MPVTNKEAIGIVALELLDELDNDEDILENWEDCKIRDIIIVVDMESSDGSQGVATRCSDNRAWVQTALLQAGIDAIED